MLNIIFNRPIILRKSLNDMTTSQRNIAENLLRNRQLLTFTKSGACIIDYTQNHELPSHYYYGSEAVCIYRQLLGLPDASLRHIDVNQIIQDLNGFNDLSDILSQLNKVNTRNERFIKLQNIGAPAIILFNEYRMLQENIEAMADTIFSKPENDE